MGLWSYIQESSKAAGRGAKDAREVVFGASDHNRLWFHEREVIAAALQMRKGIQATHFNQDGLWRSRLGYFSIWRHKNGTKGALFSFNLSDMTIVEKADPTFTNDTRYALKADADGDLDKRDIYPVKFWGKKENPKLADILETIDRYTKETATAILEHTVLFETDYEKGVYRSGAGAYVMEFGMDDKNRTIVTGIDFYAKSKNDGKLVNPYGNLYTRFSNAVLLPGIDLISLEAEKRGENGEKTNRKLTREEAEAMIYRHHHESVMRYVHGESVVPAEERKYNKLYYITRVGFLGLFAFAATGKYFFGRLSLETAAPLRGVLTGLVNIVRGALLESPFLAATSAAVTILTALGLMKKKIDTSALIDPNDPLAQRFSTPARRIPAFATLQRHFRAEALRHATLVKEPTFDVDPPDSIKSENSLKQWPENQIQTSGEARGGSLIQFFLPAGLKPCSAPLEREQAMRTTRTDGIVSVNFPNTGFAWQFYTGEPFYDKAKAPPDALLHHHRPGYVLQIDNRARDRANRISYIPFHKAKALFEEKFARSLLVPGMAVPDTATEPLAAADHAKGHASLKRLQQALLEAKHQIFDPADRNAAFAAPHQAQEAKRLVGDITKKHMALCAVPGFESFINKMAPALLELSKKEIFYELCDEGRDRDRSLQLLCDFPDGSSVTIMTKNRTPILLDKGIDDAHVMDLYIVEGQEERKLNSSAEAVSHLLGKLKDVPAPPSRTTRILKRVGTKVLTG